MDFSSICRTCLSTSSLNPIFTDTNDYQKISNDINIATGVQIQINDGLPQNICRECVEHINSVLKFRTQSQNIETELLLLKPKLETSDIGICGNITLVVSHVTKGHIITEANTNLDEEICNLIKEETILSKPIESDDLKPDIKIFADTQYDFPKAGDDYFVGDEIKSVELLDISQNVSSDTLPGNIEQKTTKITTGTVALEKDNIQHDNEDHIIDKNNIAMIEVEDMIELPYNVLPVGKNEKTNRVMCKLCQKELSIRSIDSHIARRHPGADERKVKCELCDTYILKEKLNRHMALMHGSQSLQCGYCKSVFENQAILIEHVQNCSSKNKKRLKDSCRSGRELTECDICHQTMQKASLRMHKRIKHAGLRPVCEHCGNTFGNNLRLHEHYRAKHNYEKFRCSFCEFTSANIVAMRNHERRHRGEKPFVCECCGAKFHAAYLLTQHKHSHRTEKTVKCDLCPATFKANNSLHMHKLSCHSKAQYACGVCRRAYGCRHYAAKHVRRAHRPRGPAPPPLRLEPEHDAADPHP